MTRAGVTTGYRYNEGGWRITKQVGTGNQELYIQDGPLTLAVFTLNASGTLSYDYDPYGMLMPSRTLAGTTKEGFTSKERDTETGLDYFGARYYLGAVGRWSSVDPMASAFPQWNPYNYVFGEPTRLVDPDGRCPVCVVGAVWALYEVGSGAFDAYNAIRTVFNDASVGEKVATAGFALGGALLPGGNYSVLPRLGRKLDFILGGATGSAHNIQRSRAMASQLDRIGLHDNARTRAHLRGHLGAVLNDPKNIVEIQDNGRVVRESLLTGPRGAVKMRSIWDEDRLITTTIFNRGGR